RVELEDDAIEDQIEGTIFKIDDSTHFEMVVLGELRGVNNVDLGDTIVVTINNANFEVDADGLDIPSTLQGAFESAVDTSQLLPGQQVQVRVRSVSAAPILISTDRVRLRRDQFTASLSGAPAPSGFNVAQLPGVFAGAGVSSIQVQISSKTNFQGVAGV